MKNLIQSVPLPICGVALAIASLGQPLGALWNPAHAICGTVALLLLALFLCRVIAFFPSVRADLKDPVLAGVSGTFPMCVMVLSSYVVPLSMPLAFAIWMCAVALHFVLIANLFFRAARGNATDYLTPALFVLLVGLVVADLPGVAYPAHGFCVALLWAELVVTPACLVAVTIRYAIRPLKGEQTRPLLCIYTAPTSMYLACYLAVSDHPNRVLVGILAILSAALFLFAFVNMLRCLPLRFYPSYAAMTFPFVISATATLELATYLDGEMALAQAVHYLGEVQLGIAACIVAYVLVRYVIFLASKVKEGG